MRALRTFTLLIALAGASTAHADAEKETTLSESRVERLLAFYNELVDHSVKHAADCPALATAVDGVVNRHINTIQMMWDARRAKQTVPKDVQEKMDKRAPELVGALRKCWADGRVKAAFGRMKAPQPKQ
jgi:hypothetical protein